MQAAAAENVWSGPKEMGQGARLTTYLSVASKVSILAKHGLQVEVNSCLVIIIIGRSLMAFSARTSSWNQYTHSEYS